MTAQLNCICLCQYKLHVFAAATIIYLAAGAFDDDAAVAVARYGLLENFDAEIMNLENPTKQHRYFTKRSQHIIVNN